MLKSLRNKIVNGKLTKKLLDSKNIELWNKLIKTEKIKIINGKFSSYGVYSIKNTHKIFINSNKYNSASFTHELLHIFLSTKNINIKGGLRNRILLNQNLQKIFSNDLLDNISNNLEHIKMLPLFLSMGYDREDFIDDYFLNKGEYKEFDNVEQYFHTTYQGRTIYLDKAIDCYIGIYFSAKACPNPEFNYDNFYLKLRNIDEKLFIILESFLEEWNNYNYENIYETYNISLEKFIQNLKDWCENKEIFSTN